MFWNCLPNTLDTTVWQSPTAEGGMSFVSTGDQASMYLRDSQNQVDLRPFRSVSGCRLWQSRDRWPAVAVWFDRRVTTGAALHPVREGGAGWHWAVPPGHHQAACRVNAARPIRQLL